MLAMHAGRVVTLHALWVVALAGGSLMVLLVRVARGARGRAWRGATHE